MKFRLNDNGSMEMVSSNIKMIDGSFTIPKMKDFYVLDYGDFKREYLGIGIGKKGDILVAGTGIFWVAFMDYIFPIMLDIAKVYCAFKVAQAFYEEKGSVGGRDGRTGFSSLVYYGKWYLAFWLIPYGVELIDQLGGKMLSDLNIKNQ